MRIVTRKLIVFFLLTVLLDNSVKAQHRPDLSTVPVNLVVPQVTPQAPAAGVRVKQTTVGWGETDVYHVLYLPRNWKPNRKFPIIVEFAGNGNYKNKYGDVSDGSPEGSSLGYGLSKGRDFIWVCMPFIENKNGTKQNATQWWGEVDETKQYLFAALKMLEQKYGADPNCIILSGFSRGAIACNYIGLYDDEIASTWKAFFCHSHYDGVRNSWPYPYADSASALKRLERLKGRPQWISQEGSTSAIKQYLLNTGIQGDFTFQDIPYRNHSDQWLLKKIPESKAARCWLRRVVKASRQ